MVSFQYITIIVAVAYRWFSFRKKKHLTTAARKAMMTNDKLHIQTERGTQLVFMVTIL